MNTDIDINDVNNNSTEAESYNDLFIKSQQKCCGSSVFSSIKLNKKIMGSFRRSIVGPAVYLDYVSEDQIPPSKIGDLKILQMAGGSSPDRLMAEWTAPGGDYDIGSVASYRFVFSPKIEDLIDPIKGRAELVFILRKKIFQNHASKTTFLVLHVENVAASSQKFFTQ